VNKLGSLGFDDVAANAKAEATDKPVVAVAETFDNLVYRVKAAKKKKGDEYLVSFTVAGEPPKGRAPEKGEKKEDTERRDKEFVESRKRLAERIAAEKALAQWTYVVGARELEPLLASRSDMTARKRDDRLPPGMMLPPGMR
jgi:hypothetical protein